MKVIFYHLYESYISSFVSKYECTDTEILYSELKPLTVIFLNYKILHTPDK